MKTGNGSPLCVAGAVAIAPLILGGAAPIAEGLAPGEGKSFIDRFENLKDWYVSSGWSNGDYQGCTWNAANIRLAEGGGVTLSITDRKTANRDFSCGELRWNSFTGYGTYEVRMRAAAGPGIVSAFFTYVGSGIKKDWPHDELDFEFLGKTPNGVQLNYFVDGDGQHGKDIALDFDATETMNDYAVEWLPQSIRWFINGRQVHEVLAKPDTPLPSRAQKIFLSIWLGTGANMEGWLGRFSYPGSPMVAKVEYVAFTAVGEPCQFPTSIVCARGQVPGSR